MFDDFSHFLAYGSTDQQTLRSLTDRYQGLIVPGTIAAYQADGTRGFVLTLSAAVDSPYAIDPRTPLFQYFNPTFKKSHLSLARILGIEDVLDEHSYVRVVDWTEERVHKVAAAWLDFNTGYTTLAPKAFAKYARRLKRELPQDEAKAPTWIFPPYLMVEQGDVASSVVNEALWHESLAAASAKGVEAKLRRVVAVTEPAGLASVIADIPESELVVWVDNLDETSSTEERLRGYALAIRDVSARGKKPFALYGGYFAVMLRAVGLRGASHGVGFSEYRNHVELRSSGAAPPRYYVQRIHRYLPVDLASELWRRNSTLVESYFPGFENRDPAELDYHELMKLSVNARQDEILRAADVPIGGHRAHLVESYEAYARDLTSIRLTEGLRKRITSNLMHLLVWSRALDI